MKKAYIYAISFFSVLALFTMLYFISFRMVVENQTAPVLSYTKSDPDSVPVVTSSTKYIVQMYNSNGKKLSEKVLPLPKAYLGLSRQKLTGYLDKLHKKNSKDEAKEGFLSEKIITLGPTDLIVRRTYDINKVSYEYYLTSVDGFIVVYEKDRKTIFDQTDIATTSLGVSDREQLDNGICVKDKRELYFMLESYSS
ncbi:hypothetical protein lbkm_0965 [Lachnospiraceae bacterium KM106-2]|nr:hypothetical protein lbkm_0965 [Lachnospiraceae bacterium KM106-2]